MSATPLPELPAPHVELVSYLAKHPDKPMTELLEPYRKYEAQLRQLYAQEPEHAVLKDPHVNTLPLFTKDTPDIKVRARNLKAETEKERNSYIMPLPAHVRRAHGSLATVQSLKEFRRNFNVFSESSLVEMDWSNVVAAGSSVVNCLLPVPKEYDVSKRTLREFYHEKFAPASDVDLFLYGLTEEEAVEKIKSIETHVRDSLLTETTTVRTKHAVTICSQHPIRHIQIVLRIYKSVSEILTGFDIDCSGAAYDGKQVYCSPRALQSYITQINHIDLSRRSPSYENRLSKYSHRGFEVYWKDLERDRVDPTIFERSFNRLLGLARLLVLERLPTSSDRDKYLQKRREERGRPSANQSHRQTLYGNIKDEHEDEVAEWVNEDEVSNYHTFTVPYGPKFHAKKIEKLCYTRDLLLNAEWNQPDDREVYLHRHPAFFGRFEDVIDDCCGYCPEPVTEEEKEIAEEESKIYVSGKISFIKDDPGRQQIGSFNPLTDDDWTEMAYVGNTARLCQAIVDCDVEHVDDWLAQEGADPNTRDYTGRTPLHLAVMSSTPEIVRRLVDSGARLVARIADGRTALHLAAERGDVEIVKILMDKSLENEALEEEKKDQRRKAKATAGGKDSEPETVDDTDSDEESDGELVDDEESNDDIHSIATGSFVKVGNGDKSTTDSDEVPEGDENDPDFYDVNIVAWDTPCSALHLAIVSGHEDVVKLLCQEYGADVLLPVKFLDHKREPCAALLTLVLALALPIEKAKSMAATLLSLGATSAQADLVGVTAFHQFVKDKAEAIIETLWALDKTGTKAAINHIAFPNYNKTETPLQAAARNGDLSLVLKLLDKGALVEIDFESWLKSAKQIISEQLKSFDENQALFKSTTDQPLTVALKSSDPSIALRLIEHGADVNAVTPVTHDTIHRIQKGWYAYNGGESALDIVQAQLKRLRKCKAGLALPLGEPKLADNMDEYLANIRGGSYQHWLVSRDIKEKRKQFCAAKRAYDQEKKKIAPGVQVKSEAIQDAIETLEGIEKALLEKGAKTFEDLYPEVFKKLSERANRRQSDAGTDEATPKYTYGFDYSNVVDVTPLRKVAYLDLFEAAWDGNLERIKELTLTAWDSEGKEAPLKIAVYDKGRNNPFSLAFFRGHHSVAKSILEITHLQYAPEEKPKTRYRMASGHEDSEYESDYDSENESGSDGSQPEIRAEIIDQRFTIENVGQVSMKVNSRTRPLEILEWKCAEYGNEDNGFDTVLNAVIRNNDLAGLKFLLGLGEHFSAQKLEPGDETARFYSFPDSSFKLAVESGRIELLTEIIRRTGSGLPLEELVKHSGVELHEKPRYYQGLTVYGRKRKDWASSGRRLMTKQSSGIKTSPLILAALAGCIESVEWFQSDTPLRLYLEFGKSKAAADDARMKHLKEQPGGLEKAVSNWLNDQNELVIHAAILAPPCSKTDELVSYLIKSSPGSVDVKSQLNITPLFLAASLARVEITRRLVDAGADQTVRNSSRENLLHAALRQFPSADRLESFLSLLDPKQVQLMTVDRDSRHTTGDGGKTPLHRWLKQLPTGNGPYKTVDEVLAVLRLLIKYSGGRELDLLDAAGDTVLHMLVMRHDIDPALVRAILDVKADLLYRENAVGRTPAEIARGRFVAENIKTNDNTRRYYYNNWYFNSDSDPCKYGLAALADKPPLDFIKEGSGPSTETKEAAAATGRSHNEQIWDICREYLERHPGRRRLVSLHEANDVARRLGAQNNTRGRYAYKVRTPDASERGGEEDETEDETRERRAEDGLDVVAQHWASPRWTARCEPQDAGKDGEKWPVCEVCGDRHGDETV